MLHRIIYKSRIHLFLLHEMLVSTSEPVHTADQSRMRKATVKVCLHVMSPCPLKFNIVSMLMGALMVKMGCTLVLSLKKTKCAAHKKGDVNITCKRSLSKKVMVKPLFYVTQNKFWPGQLALWDGPNQNNFEPSEGGRKPQGENHQALAVKGERHPICSPEWNIGRSSERWTCYHGATKPLLSLSKCDSFVQNEQS